MTLKNSFLITQMIQEKIKSPTKKVAVVVDVAIGEVARHVARMKVMRDRMRLCRETLINFVTLVALSAFVLLLAGCDFDIIQEAESGPYNNVDEIVKTKGLKYRAWYPSELPNSATHIQERHNWDYNKVVVRFIMPHAEIEHFVAKLDALSRDSNLCAPTWLARKSFIPEWLYNGDFDYGASRGWVYFSQKNAASDDQARAILGVWKYAIQRASGEVIAWT